MLQDCSFFLQKVPISTVKITNSCRYRRSHDALMPMFPPFVVLVLNLEVEVITEDFSVPNDPDGVIELKLEEVVP